MEVDLLAGFGVGFLGSRLKRLAERMQADAAEVARFLDLPVQPAQMSMLMTIRLHGPITVGELAERLQLAQPTITRALGALGAFVEARRAPGDARSKSLALTPAGEALLVRVQTELLPRIEPAAAELVQGLSGDFMQGLAKVEARLAERSLLERIQAAGRPAMWARDFSDDLAETFHQINAEWIGEMFALEQNDIDLLSRPRELILDKGGVVLFAETPELGVVGTCALMVSKDGWVELTKMGVLKSARGLKVGEFLLAKTLERAASLGMDKVYLLTNKKCGPAIHLYEKLGFVHDAEIMQKFGARYERCDVAMSYRPTPQAPT
ncbi:bifunctional helix-turn-helix transcriptional regulator/GNAT family N-acetyltransferase [Caulobacter segnis]|jgi:DNA-binding MarR family transcriptional regulator/N-acetylglutamate synthase-like GNAT family acetyltransferase|uniref:bifunctional helix-turn-helix transcriptional regulator/GNAT family N-acetyltransferase n=1 Tax=Caulobacter segnis TaxID=88688 RepID=UPI001CC19F4B|nr:bifunctional helix-turn-helix transcriptional regulator/GNAT family N-acetyltransferase [Caulobacter segnis]UAL11432.1 bifunctional helix-turn-helix transcriptional regulator/GNAT family N-acetyltransferase [Caulobacter segnis]